MTAPQTMTAWRLEYADLLHRHPRLEERRYFEDSGTGYLPRILRALNDLDAIEKAQNDATRAPR